MKNVIATLIGFVLALLIGEATLRVAGFEYTLYPSKLQFGWPTPETLEWRYKVDPYLLWTQKKYEKKISKAQKKPVDFVFMGGSCTEIGTFDERLQGLFEQQNQPMHYVNLGVGGWSSLQGRRQFERDVVKIKPTYAVIYFGWNDHWLSFGLADKDMGTYYEEFTVIPEVSNLRLAQMFNYLYVGKQRKNSVAPNRVPEEDYYDNLSHMITLARENGITPVLVTAPSSHREGAEPVYLKARHLKDLKELVPLHRRYVEITRQVAEDHNVLLVDLYEHFYAQPQQELEQQLIHADGIHLREPGSQLVAELLFEALNANTQ